MSERVRRYFVPALAMQVLATAVLVGIQQAGVEPHVILVQGVVSGGFLFYIPWLLALPIIGALRGLWGRTQGEHGGTIVLGAAVPVLVIGGLLATASLLGVVEHAVQGHSLGWWYVKAVGTMLVTWFVVPGLAMLAGAVPFAIQSRAQRAIA